MLKKLIRFLKTSPLLMPVLALVDLVLLLIDTLAILTAPSPKRPNSLVIIRLDVMGDYLMFRNYLRQIKESARYKGYRLALLGNVAVKSLAETFDADVIDQFIWVDIYKLTTRPFYRFQVIRRFRSEGFSVVFCPTYSRVLVLDDYLALASGASERVGCETDFTNSKPWEAAFGNRLYTRLISSEAGILFEMERDRRIVEGFLREPLRVQPPMINSQQAKWVAVPDRYVVLSLGAGQDFRVWPIDRFAEVARFLLAHHSTYKIVLTGAATEKIYAESFLAKLSDTSAIIDLTGSLSLPELVYVLTKADLLLANETGIAHIAAATHTPTVVISQGKSLVRWHPYPAGFGEVIAYVYPAYIEQHRPDLSAIASDFNPESRFSMSEITVDRVVKAINQKLPLRKPIA